MKSLLTPCDLAAILRVSKGHVYRLVQQRKVPFIKNGGSVRFRPESIERWIQEQEVVSVREVLRGRK
jgi:excisionase family DNA binding protein